MAQGRQKELLPLLEDSELLEVTRVGTKSWRISRIKFQILEDLQETEQLHSLAVATIKLPDLQTSGNSANQPCTKHTNHDLLVFEALVKTSLQINTMYVSIIGRRTFHLQR